MKMIWGFLCYLKHFQHLNVVKLTLNHNQNENSNGTAGFNGADIWFSNSGYAG